MVLRVAIGAKYCPPRRMSASKPGSLTPDLDRYSVSEDPADEVFMEPLGDAPEPSILHEINEIRDLLENIQSNLSNQCWLIR